MKMMMDEMTWRAHRDCLRPFTVSGRHCSGYHHAIELLKAEADRLRAEYDLAASSAASPYHMAQSAIDAGFKAQDSLLAALWLQEQISER